MHRSGHIKKERNIEIGHSREVKRSTSKERLDEENARLRKENKLLKLLAPDTFGHPAGADVGSAPVCIWTPRRSTSGQLSLQTGT